MNHAPDPESAEEWIDALPLLDVDWELLSDEDFRALLAARNFEASYDPTKRELTIRVTLVPELTHPDGPRAPLLFVPRQDSCGTRVPGPILPVARAARSVPPAGFMRDARARAYPAGGPRCALSAPGGNRTR